MKLKSLLIVAAVLMLVAAFAVAAGVDGKWTSESQRQGQTSTTAYEFKADGAKLTGSLTMPGMMGGEPTKVDITEGKIDGDNITFVVIRKFGENEMKSTYKGKVAGDEIKFTVERAMPAGMGGPGGGMGGPGAGGPGAGGPGMGGPGAGGPGAGGPGAGGAGRGGPQEIVAKRVK